MSQSDFAVDKDDLDGEWVRQPELYHDYAVKLADARLEMETKKNRLEVIQANLDNEIREDPSEFGLTKVTEGAIKAVIVQHPKYEKALERVNQARHAVDILVAATQALDHKKKALENLVYLHGQNYFSSPRARGEDHQAMEEVSKKAKIKKRNPGMTRKNLHEEQEDD